MMQFAHVHQDMKDHDANIVLKDMKAIHYQLEIVVVHADHQYQTVMNLEQIESYQMDDAYAKTMLLEFTAMNAKKIRL